MFNFFKKPNPEKAFEECINKKNVCGTATDGKKVLVLVEKKEALDKLNKDDIIPDKIDGVKTDVIEVGEVTASFEGKSGASLYGTACTIGAVGTKNGKTYFLQNSHCAPKKRSSQSFVSPSPMDSRRPKKIGKIVYQNEFNKNGLNVVDVLLAESILTGSDKPQISHSGVLKPKVGDTVISTGRTTGKKELKVIADNVRVRVRMPDGVCTFVNQLMLEGRVRGGDSGSSLVKDDKFAGLVFASNNNNIGFANCPEEVIRATGLTFEKKYGTIWDELLNFKKREFKHPEKLEEKGLRMLDKLRTKATELAKKEMPIHVTSDWRPTGSHSAGTEFDFRSKGGKFYELLNNLYAPGKGQVLMQIVKMITKDGTPASEIFGKDEQFIFVKCAIEVGFNRIGVYNGHIHVGYNPDRPQDVVWTGISS